MGAKSDKLFGRVKSASDDLRIWQIKFLEDISDAVGGGGGGGALALESTQLSVLNALTTYKQDVEVLLVRDTGNSDEVVQQITDYSGGGAPVITYKDVNGVAYVPVGPLEYLDPAGVLNLMLTQLNLLNAGGQLALDATVLATNVILTAMDGVLDNILLDTTSIDTSLTAVTRTATPTRIATLSGGTAGGERSIAFYNAHATVVATIGGMALNPGESISFDAGGQGDTLASITIVVTAGDLIVTTVV